MDEEIATRLLQEAAKTPDVVDQLWEAANGTPSDPYGVDACLRLDRRPGGKGTLTSEIAVEFSHNARRYIDFLMAPRRYPQDLKAQLDSAFPPFGHTPQWTIPAGFRQDGWFLRWLHNRITPHVIARFRRGGKSAALIIVLRPSPTELSYPWQQALDTHHALSVWDAPEMKPRYQRISSRYVAVGPTRAYEVCYKQRRFEAAKTVLLTEPGIECVFEFQTLSLTEEKKYFDDFIAQLR